MTQNRIRNALMDGAVRLAAKEGIEKLTTRNIAAECDLHDAYIYRYFIDKDDLISQAFLREDRELNRRIAEGIANADMSSLTLEKSLRIVLMPIWEYLVANEDVCKFYVRYYYSIYFKKFTLKEFKTGNSRFKEAFDKMFPSNMDTEIVLLYAMDTILSMAMKVVCGEINKTSDIEERVFKLIYSIVKTFIETDDNMLNQDMWEIDNYDRDF